MFNYITIILFAFSMPAIGSTLSCTNAAGDSIVVEIKETDYTPFLKVSTPKVSVSGFAEQVDFQSGKKRLRLKASENHVLFMTQENGLWNAYWSMSLNSSFDCQ